MRTCQFHFPGLGLFLLISSGIITAMGSIRTAPNDVTVLDSLNVAGWQQLGGDPCNSSWTGVQCACPSSATGTPTSCTVVEASGSVYAYVVSISLEPGALNKGLASTLPGAISSLSALQALSLSSQLLRQVYRSHGATNSSVTMSLYLFVSFVDPALDCCRLLHVSRNDTCRCLIVQATDTVLDPFCLAPGLLLITMPFIMIVTAIIMTPTRAFARLLMGKLSGRASEFKVTFPGYFGSPFMFTYNTTRLFSTQSITSWELMRPRSSMQDLRIYACQLQPSQSR